jgi:hypothetical protein
MRIQLKIDGGMAYFPGLNRPISLDSNTLPAQEADRLKQLLEVAHFFELPPVLNAPSPGAADHRQYTITVDDDNKHHTIQVTDPIEDPDLQALLTYLKTKR